MKYLTGFILLLTVVFSAVVSAEVAVIVNPANATALSDKDIERIFLGKQKRFAEGHSIKVIYGKTGAGSRVEFEQKALRKSSSQIKAYWSKLVFTGKGKPPTELSEADAIKFVADNRYAIAYVDASKVDASVKVLKKY